jgi:hypothetical protein
LAVLDIANTSRSKLFGVALTVDGKPFRQATPDCRITMGHAAQFLCPRDDFSCFTLSHYITAPVLAQERIAHTDIHAEDITEVTCKLLTAERATEQLRDYHGAEPPGFPFVFAVTLKAKCCHVAVPFLSYRALNEIDAALETQLKSLRETLHADDEHVIQMLISVKSKADALAVVNMCHVMEAHQIRDTNNDILAAYFVHAPVAKTLFQDRVLPLDEKLEPRPDVTYWKKHQMLVHHVYGSVYDYNDQRDKTNALPQRKFKAFTLRLPHVEHDAKCLLFVEPGENGAYLPRDGDTCKISSDAFKFPAKVPDAVKRREQVAAEMRRLQGIWKKCPDYGDQVAWIRRRAPEVGLLGDAQILSILPICTDEDVEERSDWEARFTAFFAEDSCRLQLVEPVTEITNNDGNWLSAYRQDVPFVHVGIDMQVYVVSKPRAKSQPGSSDQFVNVAVPMLTQNDKESIESFIKRTREASFEVVIARATSDKTLRAEILAINALIRPSVAKYSRIAQKSRDAFEYILAFREDPAKAVDLFGELPGIGRVVEENAANSPPWVQKEYRRLHRNKREVMKSLSSLPHGIGLISGVAGCGKSTLLKTITLAAQYGGLDASVTPDEIESKPDFCAMYIVNTNGGVDKYAKELVEMYERLGLGEDAPDVIRLYPMDSELSAMLRERKDTLPETFNPDDAAKEMETFDMSDHLVAQYQILNIAAKCHNAKKMARERKNQLRKGMSLHTHACEFLLKNKEEYEELTRLVDMAKANSVLTDIERTSLRENTRVLYEDFLKQFRGIICTTPVAASNLAICENVRPHLIMVDESARMRELSSLITLAWWGPVAWIFVGDDRQLRPHVALDVDETNPFQPALRTSLLARAIRAGAVNIHLNFNHRQYGSLSELPSEMCYLGQMVPAVVPRFSEAARKWNSFLQTINPNHPEDESRLLIELPGSRTGKIGTSTFNLMHVKQGCHLAKLILNADGLTGEGKNRGNPANVLVLALYRAQCSQYLMEVERMRSSGELSEQQFARVRVHTLDSSQGDEEDIVIVDMTQASQPGFCGENNRACLLLTRATVGQIILMDKGMWLCSDAKASVVRRAMVLRKIQHWQAERGAILTIPCCDRCESFGHMTINCTSDARKDGAREVCRIPCKKPAGHTADTCPNMTVCGNCKLKGRTANECQSDMRCYRCGNSDHISYECPN